MKRADLQRAADPAAYAESLATTNPAAHGGHEHHEVVRTDTYEGHSIVVRTTYEIEVDGRPVTAHMHIDNDGNVLCHAIPVYQSASMVEIVRRLIDVFPDDFPLPEPPKGRAPKRPRAPRPPAAPGSPGTGEHHHHGGGG